MKKEEFNSVKYIIGSFILILLVSFYRNISQAYLPEDFLRPYIVYAVYSSMLCAWSYSLSRRLTQKCMLKYILIEVIILELWLIVRLFQESFIYVDLHLMRVSGYLIVVPFVLAPLLGFYSSLGLGMSVTYRIPRKMLCLIIPASLLILFMLTNEKHHLVFRIYENETENLNFYPNFGTIPIAAWSTVMIILRIIVINHKTKRISTKSWIKILPLVFGISLTISTIPNFISNFNSNMEPIELTTKLYFIEILTWESCILSGMVPVNTHYREVFEYSNAGLQIVRNDGTDIVSSEYAGSLNTALFNELTEKKMFLDETNGQEIHMQNINSGCLIYRKDVSKMLSVLRRLKNTEEELKQENMVLSHELKTRSDKIRVAEQNKIYDFLTGDVEEELSAVKTLLEESSEDKVQLFRRVILMGTYIKRRCNLQLIMQQTGQLNMTDFKLTIREFTDCLNKIGIEASINWKTEERYPDGIILNIPKIIEIFIIENNFEISKIDFSAGIKFIITVNAEKELVFNQTKMYAKLQSIGMSIENDRKIILEGA